MATFNPKKSLRIEIILCILIAIVPALVILFFSVQHVQQDLKKELIERAEGAQKTVATTLENLIKNFKSSVANQSKEEVVLELLNAVEKSEEEVLKIIQYFKKTADVKEVTIYNASGLMIASTDKKTKQKKLDTDPRNEQLKDDLDDLNRESNAISQKLTLLAKQAIEIS